MPRSSLAMSFCGLSDFPAHSMKQLRLNVTADQSGYTRIADLCGRAVGFAFNNKSSTILIFDSIQLAIEVVHHSYYSWCSWPCHASLFLWLLRKQRNNILTGVEEGGFAVGTQKTSLSNFLIWVQLRGRTCRSRSAGSQRGSKN